MPIFEQGSGRRSNKENLQISNSNNTTNYTLIPSRVIDIILDENHPKYTSWNDIGSILFESIDESFSISQTKASSIFPQLKSFPLINEIVFVISVPKGLDYDSKTVSSKYFYFNPIGMWNNPHNNAVPNSIPFSKFFQNLQNKSTYGKSSINPQSREEQNEPIVYLNSQKNFSQNTFVEKSNIYPLMPFMGDNIIEGRYGQSIRLGHTAQTKSNKKNNWSESGENGDPIIILRNGQSPLVNEPGWVPTTENIRDDLSSIYLTSTQKLKDFKVAGNENYSAFPSQFLPQPPSLFINPQIALNSNRITINAKEDSILLSAKKTISLSVEGSVGISSPSFYVGSNKIRLGGNDAKEPILKGNITISLLKSLVESVEKLAQILEVEKNWPQGALVTSNNTVATNAKTILQDLLKQLDLDESKSDSLKSYTSKVK
tara:strand:- start:1474 stop:2763 length:1290 start_codon:yes stop_codon:yes gene_type:complete